MSEGKCAELSFSQAVQKLQPVQIWNSLLLQFANDIPAGVAQMLFDNNPSDISLMYSFYCTHEKICDFLEYVINREIVGCYEFPTNIFSRKSVFSSIISSILVKESTAFMSDYINTLPKKLSKMKLKVLHTLSKDNSSFVKTQNKFKDLLDETINVIVSSKKSCLFIYVLNVIAKQLHIHVPTLGNTLLKKIVFLPIIEVLSSSVLAKNHRDDLQLINNALLWGINENDHLSEVEQDWKHGIYEKLSDARNKFDGWLAGLQETEIESCDVYMDIKGMPPADQLPKNLLEDWEGLKGIVCQESFMLIQLRFSETSKLFDLLIHY
ncbi:Ras-GAP domain-containing protein [Entamoeba marina]